MPTGLGGEVAKRPLHLIFLVDTSGSMQADGKIQSLNTAIRIAIPEMQSTAAGNPFVELLVRVVQFGQTASWVTPNPVPVEQFTWKELTPYGQTAMGAAIKLVAEQMKIPPMTQRAMPPVLVLVSDGIPTDDFSAGLKELLSVPWGKRAVRISIGIGSDADYDVLQSFVSNPLEIPVLRANNPQQLVDYIKFASTSVVETNSAPKPEVVDKQVELSLPHAPVPPREGRVVTVGVGSFTIANASGSNSPQGTTSVLTDANTIYTKDGAPANASDLEVQSWVTLEGGQGSSGFLAKEVRISGDVW